MNDFVWRKRARRIAQFFVFVNVCLSATIVFFLMGEFQIFSFFNQDDPLTEELAELFEEIYDILGIKHSSPQVYFLILRGLFVLIFYMIATKNLLNGTRLVTDTAGISKAVENCKSWQTINAGVFFFSLLLETSKGTKIWLSGGLSNAELADALVFFLVSLLIRQWFHNQVGKYISELQRELRRRG